MTEKEIAIDLYKQEHQRWNQLALFFFGSIVSVFVIYDKIESYVPLWVPFLIGSFLSLIWVLVALNIRATTRAWQETIRELEKFPTKNAYSTFDDELNKFSRGDDLLESLSFWKRETYIRVTRILTIFGILSSIIFFVSFLILLIGC